MGLSLERKNLLNCRSERVKAVDFHPSEPWILSALYNGTVTIRNYLTDVLVKTIEVCDSPVRTAKFIARKNWIIVGSDDLIIRVFNYNTLERVTQFAAHSDYIRGLAIHPTRSLILSCSDDHSIKLWDWEKSWKQIALFEGHTHYVMGIALNPKDSNSFATVSLDKTIKMWSLNMVAASNNSSSSNHSTVPTVRPNYTLDSGHEKGINCVDFYGGSDRPFLATGSDDQTVRIWDYHTKSCVKVLEGHTNNVSAVAFHPLLPLLLSLGEDGALRIWNAQTFRPEASYNFSMERGWSVACCRGFNSIGLGFDSGSVVFQLGRGDLCASLDSLQGRLIWSRARGSGSSSHGNEILSGTVRLLDIEGRPVRVPADGEVIPLTPKELGTSEVFPQNLLHSPDGRLVAVWGDGEYIIYSTIGWRNRSFGKGCEVVWSSSVAETFAVRDTSGKVFINRVSAHEGTPVRSVASSDRIFGGHLLGISTGGSTLSFYDWTGATLIRSIDIVATAVNWSPDGSHVTILSEDSCYVLSANLDIVNSPQSYESGEDGIDGSFELIDELEESLKSVAWITSNCFIYLTSENRLAYHLVGGGADESFQLAVFDRSVFLLGYLPSEQRVYLTDQDLQVSSYAVLPALVKFQSIVLAGEDFSTLNLLDAVPAAFYPRLAVFLQRRGHLREALKISTDPLFQFELALQLSDLKLARDLLHTKMASDETKWQELGRVALKSWNLPIAEESFVRGGDLASLFLLYAAADDSDGLLRVAVNASKANLTNLAFSAYVKAAAYHEAFDLLISVGKAAEAALFARTYGLGAECISLAVSEWRKSLKSADRTQIADALADPQSSPELFTYVNNNNNSSSVHSRRRSVSFDGSVSVAGSASIITLKKEEEEEELSKQEASNIHEQVPVFETETKEKIASPTVTAQAEGCGFSQASSVITENSYYSDDQMSMEVNTAGTSTRLEDLDEADEALFEEHHSDGDEIDLDSLKDIVDEEAMEMKEQEHKTVQYEQEQKLTFDDIEPVYEADTAVNESEAALVHDIEPVLEPEVIVVDEPRICHELHSESEAYEQHQEPEIITETEPEAVFESEIPAEIQSVPEEEIFQAPEIDFDAGPPMFEGPSDDYSFTFGEGATEDFSDKLDKIAIGPVNDVIEVVEDGGDVYDVKEAEFMETEVESEETLNQEFQYPPELPGEYFTEEMDDVGVETYAYPPPIHPFVNYPVDYHVTDSKGQLHYDEAVNTLRSKEKEKEKGSDAEDQDQESGEFVPEEIDFGGDADDTQGWL